MIAKILGHDCNNHPVGCYGGIGVARSISMQDRALPTPGHSSPVANALSADAHQGITHHGVGDPGLFSASQYKIRGK